MPDLPKIPCIANMVKIMGETMSERQAETMLNEAVNRTKAKIAAEKIPEWAAAASVAKEMKQEQKLLVALKKRQVAMDAGARLRLKQIAFTGKGTMAKNIQKFLQKVENLGNAIGARHVAGFFTDLRERNALDNWLDKKLGLPIMQELEQLNYQRLGMEHKVGFTGNKQAMAIAEVFFKRRMDIQATNNRWGANLEEVPGYIMLQTHSADKMRRSGKGGKLFSKEDINESYKAWRASIDQLNIDWGRTLYGEDKDSFLKGFHDAIYSSNHSLDHIEEASELRKFKKPGGSLADKISAQRVLWFADAESSFKYNEQWGIADVQQTILSTLKNGGRNTAMLQNLGTRPADNVELIKDALLTEAKKRTNAQEETNDIRSRRIDGQMALLTGKANVSVRPWLSHTVDFLKNVTLAGKGSSIIISAFSDKAFLQSRMAWEGMTAMEQIQSRFEIALQNNPDLAAQFGVYSQSFAGSLQSRWSEDIAAVAGTQKLVDFTMKYQGMNKWTASHQAAMGSAIGWKLAKDSNLPWEKLADRRRQVMEYYGFTPQEWDLIRTTKYKWEDGLEMISPDKVQEIPDEAIKKYLGNDKATAATIKRAKDLIEAKLDYYISDAVHEAIPSPTASVRSIRTLNGTQRGEWSRELAELFFVFKGFPIKAAMVMSRQAGTLGGVSGTFHALSLVAQAGALGYLSMTAKDYLRGRTARRLIDSDGTINSKVWLEALSKGGGMGIYGDLLLSDYDKRYRGVTEMALGPTLGEMANLVNLTGSAKRVALGEDKVEPFRYELFRTVENNLPLINMFPVKPAMEYLIMWQIKEALSPGVFRRTEKSVENHNYQEYWLEPIR